MVDVTNITTGVIDGDGIFDKFMQVLKLHLQGEVSAGRITGDNFAEAYIAMTNLALTQAVGFTLQAPQANAQEELIQSQIKLTEQKTKTELGQISDTVDGVPVTGLLGKQKQVYAAQIKGFKDDAFNKAAKIAVDVWNVQRSTDEAITPPSAFTNDAISTRYDELITQIKSPI